MAHAQLPRRVLAPAVLVEAVVEVVRDVHARLPPRLLLEHVNVHVEGSAPTTEHGQVIDAVFCPKVAWLGVEMRRRTASSTSLSARTVRRRAASEPATNVAVAAAREPQRRLGAARVAASQNNCHVFIFLVFVVLLVAIGRRWIAGLCVRRDPNLR